MSNVVENYINGRYIDEKKLLNDKLNAISYLNPTALDIVRQIKNNPAAVDKMLNVYYRINDKGDVLFISAPSLYIQAASIIDYNIQNTDLSQAFICHRDESNQRIDMELFNEVLGAEYELIQSDNNVFFAKKKPSWIEYIQYRFGMMSKFSLFALMLIPIIGWAVIGFFIWYTCVYMFNGMVKDVE